MSGLQFRVKKNSPNIPQNLRSEQMVPNSNKENPIELHIKPVYDVSTYGEDVVLQLGVDDGPLESITPSTADFGQVLENGSIPIDELDLVISDIDTIGLLNEGDDTAFDKTYEWTPDMSAFIYKIGFSMAFGLKVTGWAADSFNIDGVRIIITQELPRSPEVLLDKVFDSAGLTPLGADGAQILLFNTEIAIAAKKITQGIPLTFRIIINETVGTGTRQIGIIPLFCFQSEAIAKLFTTSVMKFHVHASLDHAFPVFRSQNAQELLDYSGVNIRGAGIF